MTVDEAKRAFEELKSQGKTEEEIAGALYLMFRDDLINVDELGNLIGLLGFELKEEFLAMTPEEQKEKGWTEGNEPIPAVEGEKVEDAQPEPKETPKQPDNGTTYEESSGKGEKDSEDEERSKAMRLMGLNKK